MEMTQGEIKILEALFKTESLCFGDLRDKTKLSKPVLSENLKRLERKGLLIKRIEGKFRKYRLTKRGKLWINKHLFFKKFFESLNADKLRPNSFYIIETDEKGAFRKLYFTKDRRILDFFGKDIPRE